MRLFLAFVVFIAPILAHAASPIIYEGHHDSWFVRCTQDPITDRKSCAVIGQATGAGIFGASRMSILIESSDKTKRPTIVVNVPLMYFQRGLTLRFDDAAPFDIACTTISGDNCLIQGTVRDSLLASLSDGSKLAVRAYGFPDVPHDFLFSLAGCREAIDDFNTVVDQQL
jgi:invasion protein IalB